MTEETLRFRNIVPNNRIFHKCRVNDSGELCIRKQIATMRTFIFKSLLLSSLLFAGLSANAQGPFPMFNNRTHSVEAQPVARCRRDFEEVGRRRLMVWHHFHDDLMLSTVQTLILDFFDFHARIGGDTSEIQSQAALTMSRFIAMLERGDYRKNREVTYYASELCIAPKYLSEICKSITGNSANWWINRFTVLDISRQLRDRSLSFVDISEMFNFSSPAYFSRYVQRYLGESPSEYRG